MRRREFVTLLSSVAVIWPLLARAQQTGRLRRVACMLSTPPVPHATAVRRVAFVYSPDISAHVAFMHAAEAASTTFGMTVTSAGVRTAAEIEPALRAFAKDPDGGLIVAPSPFNTTNQELILALASELRLPAIYPFRYFVENGGLASYGFDTVEQHRGAASYVDRILKGEKPGDLPVQAPTKYDLVINLKTAKALGLNVSLQLQQRADGVIE